MADDQKPMPADHRGVSLGTKKPKVASLLELGVCYNRVVYEYNDSAQIKPVM